MAVTTEIITTTEIIDLVVPQKAAFEARFFEKDILRCQIKYLRPILGTDYYEDLRDKVAGSTTNANDDALLGYLKPMLANYILYEVLPFIQNKITNSGVMSDFNEFANNTESKGLQMMRDQYLTNGQDFEAQAVQFIEDTQDDDSTAFPLYECVKRTKNKNFIIG